MNKQTADIRQAYRARWNKLNRALDEIKKFRATDPDDFDGVIIADVRAAVEDITQCFHEFNAYWNAHAKFRSPKEPAHDHG